MFGPNTAEQWGGGRIKGDEPVNPEGRIDFGPNSARTGAKPTVDREASEPSLTELLQRLSNEGPEGVDQSKLKKLLKKLDALKIANELKSGDAAQSQAKLDKLQKIEQRIRRSGTALSSNELSQLQQNLDEEYNQEKATNNNLVQAAEEIIEQLESPVTAANNQDISSIKNADIKQAALSESNKFSRLASEQGFDEKQIKDVQSKITAAAHKMSDFAEKATDAVDIPKQAKKLWTRIIVKAARIVGINEQKIYQLVQARHGEDFRSEEQLNEFLESVIDKERLNKSIDKDTNLDTNKHKQKAEFERKNKLGARKLQPSQEIKPEDQRAEMAQAIKTKQPETVKPQVVEAEQIVTLEPEVTKQARTEKPASTEASISARTRVEKILGKPRGEKESAIKTQREMGVDLLEEMAKVVDKHTTPTNFKDKVRAAADSAELDFRSQLDFDYNNLDGAVLSEKQIESFVDSHFKAYDFDKENLSTSLQKKYEFERSALIEKYATRLNVLNEQRSIYLQSLLSRLDESEATSWEDYQLKQDEYGNVYRKNEIEALLKKLNELPADQREQLEAEASFKLRNYLIEQGLQRKQKELEKAGFKSYIDEWNIKDHLTNLDLDQISLNFNKDGIAVLEFKDIDAFARFDHTLSAEGEFILAKYGGDIHSAIESNIEEMPITIGAAFLKEGFYAVVKNENLPDIEAEEGLHLQGKYDRYLRMQSHRKHAGRLLYDNFNKAKDNPEHTFNKLEIEYREKVNNLSEEQLTAFFDLYADESDYSEEEIQERYQDLNIDKDTATVLAGIMDFDPNAKRIRKAYNNAVEEVQSTMQLEEFATNLLTYPDADLIPEGEALQLDLSAFEIYDFDSKNEAHLAALALTRFINKQILEDHNAFQEVKRHLAMRIQRSKNLTLAEVGEIMSYYYEITEKEAPELNEDDYRHLFKEVTVFEKDEDGNFIYELDAEGNKLLDEDGKPIRKSHTETLKVISLHKFLKEFYGEDEEFDLEALADRSLSPEEFYFLRQFLLNENEELDLDPAELAVQKLIHEFGNVRNHKYKYFIRQLLRGGPDGGPYARSKHKPVLATGVPLFISNKPYGIRILGIPGTGSKAEETWAHFLPAGIRNFFFNQGYIEKFDADKLVPFGLYEHKKVKALVDPIFDKLRQDHDVPFGKNGEFYPEALMQLGVQERVRHHMDAISGVISARLGLSPDQSKHLLEKIGGIKVDWYRGQPEFKLDDFDDYNVPDEYRRNEQLYQFIKTKIEPHKAGIDMSRVERIKQKQTINGKELNDKYVIRKGTITDQFLATILESMRMTTIGPNASEKAIKARKDEEKKREAFFKIGQAVMAEDLRVSGYDPDNPDQYQRHKTYTIRQLIDDIERIDRIGPGHPSWNETDPEKRNQRQWVKIGEEKFDVDTARDFVSKFFIARANLVLHAGVYNGERMRFRYGKNFLGQEVRQVFVNTDPRKEDVGEYFDIDLKLEDLANEPYKSLDQNTLKNLVSLIGFRDQKKAAFNINFDEVFSDMAPNDPNKPSEKEDMFYNESVIEQRNNITGVPTEIDRLDALSAQETLDTFGIRIDAGQEKSKYTELPDWMEDLITTSYKAEFNDGIPFEFDDSMEERHIGIQHYWEFLRRYNQADQIQALADLQEKLWEFWCHVDQAFRWSVSLAVLLSIINPALFPIVNAKLLLGTVLWSYTGSTAATKFAKNWGAKKRHAENAMEFMFSKADLFTKAASERLSTTELQMISTYLKKVKNEVKSTGKQTSDSWQWSKSNKTQGLVADLNQFFSATIGDAF